ncbi:MAG: FAD-dependent oxidoreductase [Deltaproteobacteria bacterium]|nr:FAD-dependent oxidoreductase [Deltaproteobacteria bacterium]
MRKSKCKIVVIGAGVSGLTTAYRLSKDNPNDVIVIEKDSKVGGLSKTINANNSFYDLGSHRIHFKVSKKTFKLVKEMCDKALVKNKRGGKLRIKNSYIDYPITSIQFLFGIGLIEAFLCIASLIKNRIYHKFVDKDFKREGLNYESYLISTAGHRAYKLFYEPYARKVWGCEPSRISITAVKKRISMVKPTLFLKNIIARYTKKSRRNDYYYYFKGGIGYFSDVLERLILNNGARIYTNVKDFSIHIDNDKRNIVFFDSQKTVNVEFEKLVSTIPIDELVLKLNPTDDILKIVKRIRWRGLKLVYLHVIKEPRLEGETFYFPELKYIFGRVSIPKRFSKKMQPDDSFISIVCEVPCGVDDGLCNKTDKDIYDLCLEGLIKAGLLDKGAVYLSDKNFIINVPNVYPVYFKGWQEDISCLLQYLGEEFDYIYTSGKPGFFLHCNFDHSIDIGIFLADYIKRGKLPKEWYGKIDFFQDMKLRD